MKTMATTKLCYASRTTTSTSYSSLRLSSGLPSDPFQLWSRRFEHYPQALMLLQYIAATAQATAFYLLSAIWTLAQSLAWIVTAESLNWIETFGPMIVEWDIFLLGTVFLIMDVNFTSSDQDMYPPRSTASSRSSSRSKTVSFDGQAMVIGRSIRRDIASISTTADGNSSRIDPSVPLTESPKSTVFSPSLLSMMQQERAETRFYSSESKPSSPRFVESPSSSPSNSNRSSVCSVSSDSSNNEAKKSRSPSSRLTSFFQSNALHLQAQPHKQGPPAEKKRGGKNIVQKIMHPHQYKRELRVHQQQLRFSFEEYIALPESMNFRASSDGEYQPDAHHRKSFIQRLGLKKRSSL